MNHNGLKRFLKKGLWSLWNKMIKLFDLKGLDAREPFFLFLIFFYVIHHQHYESFLFQPQSPILASHIYEGIALVCKQMLKGSSYKYLLFISDRKCLSSLKFYCVDIFFLLCSCTSFLSLHVQERYNAPRNREVV